MQRASNRSRQVRAFASLVSCASLAAAVGGIVSSTSSALADPLPGETLKFSQTPLDATPVGGALWWGHDELSTANKSTAGNNIYSGTFMADDFSDKVSQPVVHVSWWGSYLQNQHFNGVKQFLVSFESDVPAGPNNPFSHPGTPLLNQVVSLGPLAPGSGTYTETPVSPGGPPLGEALYKYNAELALPFPEQRDTVYWLKITALVDPNNDGAIRWGWHDRDYTTPDPLASSAVAPGERDLFPSGPFRVWHFQDDAVSGNVTTVVTDQLHVTVDQTGYAPQNYISLVDGPDVMGQFSKDLAFQLYYVPEPATAGIMALGATFAIGRRRAARR